MLYVNKLSKYIKTLKKYCFIISIFDVESHIFVTTLGPKLPFAYDQSIHEHCVPKWQGFRLWPRTAGFFRRQLCRNGNSWNARRVVIVGVIPLLYRWAFWQDFLCVSGNVLQVNTYTINKTMHVKNYTGYISVYSIGRYLLGHVMIFTGRRL